MQHSLAPAPRRCLRRRRQRRRRRQPRRRPRRLPGQPCHTSSSHPAAMQASQPHQQHGRLTCSALCSSHCRRRASLGCWSARDRWGASWTSRLVGRLIKRPWSARNGSRQTLGPVGTSLCPCPCVCVLCAVLGCSEERKLAYLVLIEHGLLHRRILVPAYGEWKTQCCKIEMKQQAYLTRCRRPTRVAGKCYVGP